MRSVLAAPAIAFAVACAAFACKSSSAPSGPWYDTTLDRDTSYLPMGSVAVRTTSVAYTTQEGPAQADVYVPAVKGAPLVVMLPGAGCVKERYFWLGSALASHGFAVAVAQPAGTFSFSDHTTALLDEIASEMADASSPLAGAFDLGNVVLAGHSQGSVVQAALTDVTHCPTGFCPNGAKLPDGVRGLILMGFSFQTTADLATPIPAAEIPWLLLAGSREAQVQAGATEKTYQRIVDRPLYKVEIEGMNHYQFTDYVDPGVDALSGDPSPTIPNKQARATSAAYAIAFLQKVIAHDASVPDDLGAGADSRVKLEVRAPSITHADTTGLPRVLRDEVLADAFSDPANCDVVASAEYGGALYMLLRNEGKGSEVWRLKSGALEQVLFPNGETNGIYGNSQINGLLGAMAVFQNKLYVGFSSGLEGTVRGSTGAEIWSYDGAAWAPVVANRPTDPSVTISAITGCDTSSNSGVLTVAGASWQPNEWQGARLDDVDAKTGNALILDIVSNTANTLTVTSTESGVSAPSIKLDCAALPLADGTRALKVGDALSLRRGTDHSGFGQSWNKAITTMTVYGDALYVGAALNYPFGAEIYVTKDGVTFDTAVPRASLGPAVAGQASRSSSILAMATSALNGKSQLYFTANGNGGYGARLFSYDPAGALVPLIDDADGLTGLASAGLGLGVFHLTSIADFGGRLWLSSFSGNGLQVFSASRFGASNDLRIEIGQGAPLGVGFGDPVQVGSSLDVVGGQLWIGSLLGISDASGLAKDSALSWRTTDGKQWQLVSAHAFGDNGVSTTKIVSLNGARYALVGNGSLTTHTCFAPVHLYALREEAPR